MFIASLSRLNLIYARSPGYLQRYLLSVGGGDGVKHYSSVATNTSKSEVEDDKPIPYTQSKAHNNWKAAYNFFVPPEPGKPRPSAYHVISSCAFALFVYGVFREENDLDERLDRPLFETLPHLERPMLEAALVANYTHGLATDHIRKRLKEMEAEGR